MFLEMTHVVAECGDGQYEKPPSSFSNTEMVSKSHIIYFYVA
jgi:hypothetical protein